MTILQSILLGIIEGITEFLPISSTFHLIWAIRLFNINEDSFVKLFGVVIQSGAVLSVFGLYFYELIKDFKNVYKILISFIPTAIIGLLMYKIIKDVFFESQYTIIIVFILVGILFIFIEKIFEKKIKANVRVIGSITFKDALLIGITQSMALVPGVSRSGAVLLGMLLMGFKREEGAKYSFMLSLPTIFAASALDLFQSRDVLVSNFDHIGTMIVGFLTAMVTAFFSMKWLIKYLSQHSLKIFGWYRIIFGILLLFLALTGVLKS